MRQGKTIFDHFYYTEKDLETLSEEMDNDLNVVLPKPLFIWMLAFKEPHSLISQVD